MLVGANKGRAPTLRREALSCGRVGRAIQSTRPDMMETSPGANVKPIGARVTPDSRLPAGPPRLRNLVADIAMIPAQTSRDFLYRDAAHEHLAQPLHLRIRPLYAGIHGQRFVICLGPPRIED